MSAAYGYVGAAVAVICFGTYAVPAGLTPVGDGIFFQWIQCSAILVIGLIANLAFGGAGVPFEVDYVLQHGVNVTVNCTLQPYQFDPIAMAGGALWTLGNCTVIPIIGMIGLGLGMLLWGLANMVVGWLIGTFGLPNVIEPQTVSTPGLNYAGLVVAAASFVLYFFVKVEKKEEKTTPSPESTPLIASNNSYEDDLASRKKPRSDLATKITGALLSVVAGVCYGFNMTPVTYLSQKYPCAGPFVFAFSHFCGIYLASTVVMIVYSLVKRNRPFVDARSVVGGMAAGTLWAVAQCAWFLANKNLGQPVAFPIVATGPAIVANLWGIFYFKEIRGRNNLLKLVGAFAVTFIGILLIALSKVEF